MNVARRTILLFGGTGFIGRNLVAALARAGYCTFVAVRGDEGAPEGAVPLALPLDDTAAIEAMVQTHGIDTIVHLASSLKPSSTAAEYATEREAVTTPTFRLADMAARRGVRLVYFSSGGTIYGAHPGPHAAETDPCRPISFYGLSKLEIEQQLDFLARTAGLRHVTIRPSNPYGPHQGLNGTQGLISVLFGRIASGEPLQIWGDGSSVRDYIHVEDLVAATMGLIERDLDGVTLNIGSGTGHSLLDVVRAVEQVTGRQVPLDFRPARAADVPRLVLDIARLHALGLDRARPLLAGLRDYAVYLEMIDG